MASPFPSRVPVPHPPSFIPFSVPCPLSLVPRNSAKIFQRRQPLTKGSRSTQKTLRSFCVPCPMSHLKGGIREQRCQPIWRPSPRAPRPVLRRVPNAPIDAPPKPSRRPSSVTAVIMASPARASSSPVGSAKIFQRRQPLTKNARSTQKTLRSFCVPCPISHPKGGIRGQRCQPTLRPMPLAPRPVKRTRKGRKSDELFGEKRWSAFFSSPRDRYRRMNWRAFWTRP